MKLHLIPLEARLRVSEAAPNTGKNEPGRRDPWLKVLLEAASDPVMVFTSDAKLLDANPAALEVMEAEGVAEMRGRPLEDFIAAADQSVAAESKKLLASGGRGELQWTVAGKYGGRRKLNSRVAPLPELGGKTGASIIIGREITEHQQVQAELSIRLEQETVVAGFWSTRIRRPGTGCFARRGGGAGRQNAQRRVLRGPRTAARR
jgi:PAS domain S-box-containing protein